MNSAYKVYIYYSPWVGRLKGHRPIRGVPTDLNIEGTPGIRYCYSNTKITLFPLSHIAIVAWRMLFFSEQIGLRYNNGLGKIYFLTFYNEKNIITFMKI